MWSRMSVQTLRQARARCCKVSYNINSMLCETGSHRGTDVHYSSTPATSLKTTSDNIDVRKTLEREQFQQKISKVNSLSALFKLVETQNLQIRNVVQIIHKLDTLCRGEKHETFDVELEKLLGEKDFQAVGEVIKAGAAGMNISDMQALLASLLRLSSKDLPMIETLENHIIWRMTEMPITTLIRVIDMHHHHQETELRCRVYDSAITTLKVRWVEIKFPKDIITLMYIMKENDTKFFRKLEERALESIDGFSAKQLYRLFRMLSQMSIRNRPLVSALSYHMNKCVYELDIVEIANLANSCAYLNCFDLKLLQSIAYYFLSDETLSKVDAKLASKLLKSFSMLRFRDEKVMNVLCEIISKDITEVSENELASMLMTCANIDHLPPQVESKLEDIADKLQGSSKVNPKLWLDTVWSLVILQKAKPEHLESVLQEHFYQKLKDAATEASGVLLPAQLKLLNVNAASQWDTASYKGPCLPHDFLSTNDIQIPIRSNTSLMRQVLEALLVLAPAEKFFYIDSISPNGYIIDIEMLVNQEGELQAVREFEKLGEKSESSKPLPPSYKRLAFKVLNFADLTSNDVRPVGLQSMSMRHLSQEGYTVLQIPYNEVSQERTKANLVAYLDRKVKSTVAKAHSRNNSPMKKSSANS